MDAAIVAGFAHRDAGRSIPACASVVLRGPNGWRPGMPVSCDICLQACSGLLELGEPEVAETETSPAA